MSSVTIQLEKGIYDRTLVDFSNNIYMNFAQPGQFYFLLWMTNIIMFAFRSLISLVFSFEEFRSSGPEGSSGVTAVLCLL